jgi:hypothetical protein
VNQTAKLTILASLLAASALAAGCVPSLNYGSVPPEPKYTTKVTTTTATGATTHPFTTPKPRTGTISWEELNGPLEHVTRARATEAIYTGYYGGAFTGNAVGRSNKGAADDPDDQAVQTGIQYDEPYIVTEAAPQTAAPQTDAPLHQVEGPPPQQEEYQPSPAELIPTPQPGPPPAEQPDVFWE